MKADPGGVSLDEDQDADVVLEGTLVCALTGEHKIASPHEETLQSFIEQLHREYGVELPDIGHPLGIGISREKTVTGQLRCHEGERPIAQLDLLVAFEYVRVLALGTIEECLNPSGDALLASLGVALRSADKEVAGTRLLVEDLREDQIEELPECVTTVLVSVIRSVEQTPVSGSTSSTRRAASQLPAMALTTERACSYPVSIRNVGARP